MQILWMKILEFGKNLIYLPWNLTKKITFDNKRSVKILQ